MMTPILPGQVRYTVRAVDNSGWCVYENEVVIAYCDNQAYAMAICNALKLHRSAAAGRVLLVPPPVNHFLN